MGAFGRFWGRSWVSSGSETLVGFLVASWAVPAAFWVPLGRLLGRLGHQVGASWGFMEAFWRRLSQFLTPRVILYLRLSILVDFWIQHAWVWGHIVKAENQVNASRLAFSCFFLFRAQLGIVFLLKIH